MQLAQYCFSFSDRPRGSRTLDLSRNDPREVQEVEEHTTGVRGRKRGASAIADPNSGPTFTPKISTPPEEHDPFTFSPQPPRSSMGRVSTAAASSTLLYPLSAETPLPTADTFGLVVNGRGVQMTSVPNTEIDPSKFIFTIPEADSVEFVAVFLNKDAKFAPGTGGQVFFGWPNERSDVQWTELGHISNVRPSAMFKITDFKQAEISDQNPFNNSFRTLGTSRKLLSGPTTAQLGISIEELGTIVGSPRLTSQL